MASRLSSAFEQYISAMRTARSFGAHTAETTFYTPLANLLNTIGETLKPRVVFVAHPGNRDGNLPDGGLFPVANRRQSAPLPNQRPERGAVEIKPPGDSLAALSHSDQVRRYLRDYGLCFITNYHQFQLVGNRGQTGRSPHSFPFDRPSLFLILACQDPLPFPQTLTSEDPGQTGRSPRPPFMNCS